MEEQDPVLNKYADLRERGRTAYASGNVKPFGGFSPSLKRRVNLSFGFGTTATERVGEMLANLKRGADIQLIGAGADFPLHASVLEAEAAEDLDPQTRDPSLEALRATTEDMLQGVAIRFDQLIADPGGSVILAARTIPNEVLAVRTVVAGGYERAHLKPLSLEHILHSTQARLTRLPEEEVARRAALLTFHARVEAQNARLEQDPIVMSIGRIRLSQVYAFLTQAT